MSSIHTIPYKNSILTFVLRTVRKRQILFKEFKNRKIRRRKEEKNTDHKWKHHLHNNLVVFASFMPRDCLFFASDLLRTLDEFCAKDSENSHNDRPFNQHYHKKKMISLVKCEQCTEQIYYAGFWSITFNFMLKWVFLRSSFIWHAIFALFFSLYPFSVVFYAFHRMDATQKKRQTCIQN